jgi:hypothetical protein
MSQFFLKENLFSKIDFDMIPIYTRRLLLLITLLIKCKYLLNKLDKFYIIKSKLLASNWVIHIEVSYTVKVIHVFLILLERAW